MRINKKNNVHKVIHILNIYEYIYIYLVHFKLEKYYTYISNTLAYKKKF